MMMPMPSDSEKKAWPTASKQVWIVTFEKSGLNR